MDDIKNLIATRVDNFCGREFAASQTFVVNVVTILYLLQLYNIHSCFLNVKLQKL